MLYTVLFPLLQVEVLMIIVYQANYQGYQIDVHFIECQTSTYVLGIVNEFVQYVQNYFQYVCTLI